MPFNLKTACSLGTNCVLLRFTSGDRCGDGWGKVEGMYGREIAGAVLPRESLDQTAHKPHKYEMRRVM